MEYGGIGLATLIIGISEVAKRAGLNQKFIPILNLILGIGAGFLTHTYWKDAVIAGIYMGLSASGIYSGIKNVNEGIKNH